MHKQKYKKNCAERVVGIALRMFLRLSFTTEATGDRIRALPVIEGFAPSFQAKWSDVHILCK